MREAYATETALEGNFGLVIRFILCIMHLGPSQGRAARLHCIAVT
jgi:hypothetical protein